MVPTFIPNRSIIGMVHLAALPGSARYGGELARVARAAVADAQALENGGVDALMLENFFDSPFVKHRVDAVTVAAMTSIACEIRAAVSLPIGINVLRNDICSAISIAAVVGAAFTRCNVYVGAAVTDQGIIEGAAREALQVRTTLNAQVAIWADVEVKHAAQLAPTPIDQQAKDAVLRALADAVIVTGAATGAETPIDRLLTVKQAIPQTPVLVGSGVTAHTVSGLLSHADGVIVGSWLKRDGIVSAPVDPKRVEALVKAAKSA